MSKKSKKAHGGGVQHTSDDMPKIPNTILRNGTFYYYARNPQELVNAGLAKPHYKKSLGTKDYREARRRVAREAYAHENEIEIIRREHANLHSVQTQGKKSDEPKLKSLAGLSAPDKRTLVLKYFVKVEREHEALSEAYKVADDGFAMRDGILADANVFLEGGVHQAVDWEARLRRVFKDMGYEVSEDFIDEKTLTLFKKATRESYRRLVERVTGQPCLAPDASFQGIDLSSIIEANKRNSGYTIEQICERYPKRKAKGKLKPATILSYRVPFRVLREFFSPETPLESLTYADGERLIDFLARIPTNARKRYPKLSIPEAVKREGKSKEPRLLSATSQKKIFVCIKGMLSHAVEIGWLSRNPFGGRALLDQIPEPQPKETVPFTPQDLTKIFTAPKYTKVRSSCNRQGNRREGYYWLPLLSLFHGARANECASLLVEDVKEEGGIHYLNLTETDDEGNQVKNLKTKVSKRRVPLHSELIKLGFLDYVEARRKEKPKSYLFDEMTPNKDTENRAKNFSQWFGRLRDKVLGANAGALGKKFHSFRNAVTDYLREVTDSDELRYALLGWTDGSSRKNAGYGYGEGFSLEKKQSVIEKVKPPVDLSHLYPPVKNQ